MNLSFNIAERGEGSFRLLAILRWVMVLIFVSFGMQKFTLQSAQGIVQFIRNSPFISWLSVFGLRGEAYVLGVAEFGIAVLLAAGIQPDAVRDRRADGRDHLRGDVVVLLHHAGRGHVEPVDRSDGLEPGRRVPVQGHRAALRLPRAAAGVVTGADGAFARGIAPSSRGRWLTHA
ncbi:hypothetical protein [Bradyrhizobium sp. USDA 4454]